jgi:hypothetical protein
VRATTWPWTTGTVPTRLCVASVGLGPAAPAPSRQPGHSRGSEISLEKANWVRIGSVIGGETRGNEGYRRDAKGQYRGHIAIVAPDQKTASIGLENR